MKTPIHRRITYVAFISIFLIASPLVILYTMGYRYNLTKGRVQKTGILKITSNPKAATIKLNGQRYETSLTPAKIEYLLPGDYEISLSKDGYYDWQKKLAVYENGTTFAEKIMLWKKSNSQSLSTSTVTDWLITPDQNIVVLTDDHNNLSLLDINSGIFGELTGGKIETIGAVKSTNAAVINYDSLKLDSFSPSGRHLLILASKNQQTNYFVLDTLTKDFKQLSGKNYKSIHWDSNSDNLYALDATTLWQYDLTSLSPKLVLKKSGLDDFYIVNKVLYTISNQLLTQQTLTGEGAKDIKKITCVSCQIKQIKNNKAFIVDPTKNILTIIDLANQTRAVDLAYKNLQWLNGDSLIIYNDFEIYIFETGKAEPELITRLSTSIRNVIWHPQGRHLIFSTDKQIKLIELDNRELRNIITIAASDATHLVSDRAGQNLFYAVDNFGVFKLNIQ